MNGEARLERRLGVFDATMIVMGGIIGAGIFVNPSLVAQQVHAPLLVIGAWVAGGVVALAGALVYAELAARLPELGGQYAYLREAWHPLVAFLYGWTLLLVVQSGGMAAVAMTFARYSLDLTPASFPATEGLVAVATLLLLTVINCLGVRAGSTTQNVLMVLKIAAIAALVAIGFLFTRRPPSSAPLAAGHASGLLAFGAAMTPVMFAYGGWQTASFVSAEMKNPRRDLARGVVLGVLGVVTVYVAVNLVCLHTLGVAGLAATKTPASAVMQAAFGEPGVRFIAVAIAISTLGFLSQSMLTAPRVYFAMAADGVFFRSVARVDRRTHVPVVAIALQGLIAIVIALSGTYDRILNYVVSADFVWFGLTGLALFVFRRRGASDAPGFRAPGHPYTTGLFVAASWIVVLATVIRSPVESLVGFGIILAGVPAYRLWTRAPREA